MVTIRELNNNGNRQKSKVNKLSNEELALILAPLRGSNLIRSRAVSQRFKRIINMTPSLRNKITQTARAYPTIGREIQRYNRNTSRVLANFAAARSYPRHARLYPEGTFRHSLGLMRNYVQNLLGLRLTPQQQQNLYDQLKTRGARIMKHTLQVPTRWQAINPNFGNYELNVPVGRYVQNWNNHTANIERKYGYSARIPKLPY
jgi:hypothetical protein